MGNFIWPEWMPRPQDTPPSAPPPDPMVAREEKIANDTRAEQALNRFLSAKQATLFDAPDAFYRTQGEDAIHAAPVTSKNLDQLRSDLLDGLGNDYQRQRLGTALDAQMQLTRDGMARHVAEQSLPWQRGIAQDRIALLTKEAAQHHNDNDLVDALGHAAASAARAHSRVGDGPPGGEAEDAAAAHARSGVLGAAIQARLDRGDTHGANALLTQVQGQLDPAHAGPIQRQIDTVQRLGAAKDYADGIASATPATSLEEIDAQHQAAVQQAEADHADDPRQQTLARHFLKQAFDARRQELQQGEGSSANTVDEWLNTPGADGGPQRDLPPPAVLSSLDDDAVRDLVFRLGRDGRGLKVVPLPYKPSLDGTLDEASMLRNLADDAEGENTPGQSGGGIVPVNHIPDDMTAPQGNAELAQAPPVGSKKKSPAGTDKKPPPRRQAPPPEQLAYPTDKEQQEIVSHVHSAEVSQAVERRKAAWDEMLKRLPGSGPKIQAPLPEDWRAGVSPANAKLTEDAAKKYDIPPELLARLFHRESSYRTTAYNRGHKGIPQMGDDELRSVGVNPDTFLQASAETQINAGAAYLAKQYAWFRNWPQAVAAYHSGLPSIDRWLAGVGPGYHSDDERKKQYVDYGGNLRVSTPADMATKRDKDIMAQWAELRAELPYVFLGNANRYDVSHNR